MRCRCTARAAHSGEIYIQPGIGWQIRFPGRDDGLRDVRGQRGVDFHVGVWSGGVGCLSTGCAAECDGGDTFLCGFGGGADGAGYEDGAA